MSNEADSAIEILHDSQNAIVRLTLNRPYAKNAVSFALWEQFSAVLETIERGTPPRAVVLHGAGDFFCAGGDIKTPPARGAGALARATRLELGQRVLTRLRSLPALTIAAVEGRAIGIGWSLALACDVIIAAENVVFAAPFMKLGLVPDGGATWFLTKRLGRYRASEIVVSGRNVPAAEAHALGLVSMLVPSGTAVERSMAFAGSTSETNRHALELTKRLLHQADEATLSAVLSTELAYCNITQVAKEHANPPDATPAAKPRPDGL